MHSDGRCLNKKKKKSFISTSATKFVRLGRQAQVGFAAGIASTLNWYSCYCFYFTITHF